MGEVPEGLDTSAEFRNMESLLVEEIEWERCG
jgi:hypothetical protein